MESNDKCNFIVSSREFVPVYTISLYTSLEWVERYDNYSEFKLQMLFNQKIYSQLRVGYYCNIYDSDVTMILEKIDIQFDNEGMLLIEISGRSIDMLVYRRIIWGEWDTKIEESKDGKSFSYMVQRFNSRKLTKLNRANEDYMEGIIRPPEYAPEPDPDTSRNMLEVMQELFEKNIVNPEDKKRKIPGLIFKVPDDKAIAELRVDVAGYGDNLWVVFQDFCKFYQLGFKATVDFDKQEIYYTIYNGINRSYDQTTNPYVIFSTEYGNLANARYVLDTKGMETMVLVRGPEVTKVDEWGNELDEDGNIADKTGKDPVKERSLISVGLHDVEGIDRREVFIDHGEDVLESMTNAAMKELSEANELDLLDAELDNRRKFVYGRDYYVGDIVEVRAPFGLDMTARVTEFMRCWDDTGYSEVPTFEIMEENARGT